MMNLLRMLRLTRPTPAPVRLVLCVVAEGHCNTSARCDLVVIRSIDGRLRADIAQGIECLGSRREDVHTWDWVTDTVAYVGRDRATHEENVAITRGYWALMDGHDYAGRRNRAVTYGMNYMELLDIQATLNAQFR